MVRLKLGIGLACLGLTWAGVAANRTAGNVLVDVNAASIMGVAAGGAIATLPNAGTMKDFKAFGTGPTYQLRGSVPVLRFDGTAANCMTNCVKGEVPAVLLGNNPWTMEAWIFCEALTGTHTYLSWTARGSNGTVCEFRYSKDGVSNAVEHYGADYNLQWGAALPAVGQWHHVVCVRQANSIERLYLDGKQVWVNNTTLNLGSDGPMMLGGVFDRSNYNTPTMLFKGDIARLRVTDGALSAADVYANYVDDYAAFGRAKTDQDAVFMPDGTWLDGVQPADGRGLAVTGGALTLTGFKATLPYLRLTGGKVTFDGATDVVVNNTRPEKFFDEFGSAGELVFASGRLAFKDKAHFGMGGANAPFKMTIGGAEMPAVIHCAIEMGFGNDTPGTVSGVQLLRGSVVTNDSGWVRLGAGIGTTNVLAIAEGAVVDGAQILIGGWGCVCHATVAGTVRSRSTLMGIGEASDTVVTLEPTGILAARGFCEWNNTTKWSTAVGQSRLHINGGTLQLYPAASYAESTPLLNTVLHVTYENAMTVDVPLNGSTVIKAAITNVTAVGAASRFVKKGAGTLNFNAPLEGLTGDIYVDEGILTLRQKFPVGADVRIHVAKGACVSCDVNGGGASSLLPFITADSEGAIGVHGYDKNENLDLRAYPNLAVRFLGTSSYVGRITPYANHYIFEASGVAGVYPTTIADASGVAARVTVRLIPEITNNSYVELSGDNSGMTGGVTVEDGAKLWLAHAFAAGSSGAVKLGEETTLCLSAAVGASFLSMRVSADSRPSQIFLLAGAETVNVDLSRFPGCHLGTEGSVTVAQTGTVTPEGNEYHLGGGATPHASSYHGLQPGVLGDRDAETPTTVVVDKDGMIELSNAANTYSGGTVVTNGARVFAKADGYGAIPAAFDARNIYVNGGVVRTGDASFSVNANRGLWVDALGATFHPWGSYTCTYQGGLGGSGAITVTDGGHLSFTGDHNTYTGKMTFNNASSILTIGDGAHFSWASGEIATPGSVVFNAAGEGTFGGLVSGAGTLEKKGEGTVTIERAQTFTGAATVSGGTLALTGAGAVATASKIFNNGQIVIDRAPSAALGAGAVYGGGTVKIEADGTNLAIDRNVGSAMALSAKNGATVSYLTPGPNGGATVGVEDATLKVGTTASGRVGEMGDFQLNSNAALVSSNDFRLTTATGSVGGSAFWKERVNATRPWEAQFTYEIPNCPASPADGFTFLLQNNVNGAKALGGVGGSIGAVGVTPSLGAAFNVYNNDTVGWFYDNAKKDMAGVPLTPTAIQVGADIRVTHDGQGKLTTTVYSKGTNAVFRQSKAFDIRAKLGSSAAYVGVTAATGGSVCEQHVKDFRFAQDDDVPDFALTEENWQCVSNAILSTYDGRPAVRLTQNTGSVSGALAHRSRLYLERPFKISGRYVITANTATPADGVAFVFHNDRLASIGGVGGSRGFMGTGPTQMPSCAGWSINIYSKRFDFVKNAAVATQFTDLKGVNVQAQNQPIEFELAYTPGQLVFTAKQLVSGVEKVFTSTQAVSLADLIGSPFGFFAVTAATGGSTAEQWAYDLTYEAGEDVVTTDGYAGGTFSGTSALEVTGVAAGDAAAAFGEVAFADGANVTVRASGAANIPYEVTFGTVRFAGGDGTAPTVNLAANGSGAGTLKLGTVVADLTGRPLKIVGAVAPKGEKIRIELPEFKGVYKILDLRQATGVAEDDFELVTATKPPVSLRLVNGYLSAVHSTGTALFLR